MKLKLFVAIVAAFVLSAAAFLPGRSRAVPNPPHGQQVTVTSTVNACQLDFVHGNSNGTAYARIKQHPAQVNCDQDDTYVEIFAQSTSTGGLSTRRCYLDGLGRGSNTGCSTVNGFIQVSLPGHNIIGTKVNFCVGGGGPVGCGFTDFAGI